MRTVFWTHSRRQLPGNPRCAQSHETLPPPRRSGQNGSSSRRIFPTIRQTAARTHHIRSMFFRILRPLAFQPCRLKRASSSGRRNRVPTPAHPSQTAPLARLALPPHSSCSGRRSELSPWASSPIFSPDPFYRNISHNTHYFRELFWQPADYTVRRSRLRLSIPSAYLMLLPTA